MASSGVRPKLPGEESGAIQPTRPEAPEEKKDKEKSTEVSSLAQAKLQEQSQSSSGTEAPSKRVFKHRPDEGKIAKMQELLKPDRTGQGRSSSAE